MKYNAKSAWKKEKKTIYTGESSKSGYKRGREHQRDIKKMKEDIAMVKHTIEHHLDEEEQPEFEMRVEGIYRKALGRKE